jgi:hypothetical protein
LKCVDYSKNLILFNRAFNFFPGCHIQNKERIRLIGFSFARQDWFLKKQSRKTSYGSTNKFFWCPDFLVANILVIQNKANLLKFIWNAIIVARLAHICSIAETYLISTLGEAIADGVMALWITDLFLSSVSTYPHSFQVQNSIFTNEKIRVTFLWSLFRKVIVKCGHTWIGDWQVKTQDFLISNTIPTLKLLNLSCHSIAFSVHVSDNPDGFIFSYFFLMIYTTIESGAWGENFRAHNAFSV